MSQLGRAELLCDWNFGPDTYERCDRAKFKIFVPQGSLGAAREHVLPCQKLMTKDPKN